MAVATVAGAEVIVAEPGAAADGLGRDRRQEREDLSSLVSYLLSPISRLTPSAHSQFFILNSQFQIPVTLVGTRLPPALSANPISSTCRSAITRW